MDLAKGVELQISTPGVTDLHAFSISNDFHSPAWQIFITMYMCSAVV